MIEYFFDPILRAPAWGCILMCLSSSLMGVVVFLKKESLLAESLSHSSYPGVIFSMFILACLFPAEDSGWMFFILLLGALIFSFFSLYAIQWLKKKGKAAEDTALCFVLSVFFGLGIVGVSALQQIHPSWSRQIQMLLFGQPATMTDVHIVIYGSLAALVMGFLWIAYRPLQALLFDASYANSIGIRVRLVERLFFLFLILSIIVGMRSVGVILMSGMLVAPAIAARQYTNRLSTMFFLAGFFGMLSAFLGYLFSLKGSVYWSSSSSKCFLPTGPLIVLMGSLFALGSLCLAPKRGALFRFIRMRAFQLRCMQENILKHLWKHKISSLQGLKKSFSCISFFFLRLLLLRMIFQGWLKREKKLYQLTVDGYQKAAALVRLHRLWEVYLTHYLNKDPHLVHRNAEEMEHILTPDLERRLTELLSNPQKDPHHQPIPERQLL